MKRVIIVQIILSLIFTAAFAIGYRRELVDNLVPAMQRDYSIAEISDTAIETIRNIGVK